MLFPTIVEYISNLDCTINLIEDLFDQEVFRTYIKLENLLLKAGKGDVFTQEYNDVMMLWQYTTANSIKIDFKYS